MSYPLSIKNCLNSEFEFDIYQENNAPVWSITRENAQLDLSPQPNDFHEQISIDKLRLMA